VFSVAVLLASLRKVIPTCSATEVSLYSPAGNDDKGGRFFGVIPPLDPKYLPRYPGILGDRRELADSAPVSVAALAVS
jgi:hypothetical protein